MKEDKGTIKVTVRDSAGNRAPIAGAQVLVSRIAAVPLSQAETDQNGHTEFELNPGEYQVSVAAFVKVVDKVTYVEMNIRR